jgi:hypothetical protein
MKNITPVQIWTPNGTKTATKLQGKINNDNMDNAAGFHWRLFESDQEMDGQTIPGQQITEGNLDMTPEEYAAWDNSNEQAYEFIANQINVVIVTE